MKTISMLTCSALLIAGSAFAADSSTTPPSKPVASVKAPDQCSKDATAKGLHGKARKSFLHSCRKGTATK